MVSIKVVWWVGKIFYVKDCQFNEPCAVKEVIDHCGLSYTGEVTCFGHKVDLSSTVKDGDRIELHAKVLIDPMAARKIRHKLKKQRGVI